MVGLGSLAILSIYLFIQSDEKGRRKANDGQTEGSRKDTQIRIHLADGDDCQGRKGDRWGERIQESTFVCVIGLGPFLPSLVPSCSACDD